MYIYIYKKIITQQIALCNIKRSFRCNARLDLQFNTLQEILLFFRQTISVSRPFEGGHSWPEVGTVCFDRTLQHS